jgi:PAS domain S-box-containing protein
MVALCLVFRPGQARGAPNTNRLERVALSLPDHHSFRFAGYYAALEQGYYREAGLDVVMQEGFPNKDTLDEMLTGRAHYSLSGINSVMRYLKGQPVVMVAPYFQHSSSVFLVLEKSGIRTPLQLAGKRIMLRESAPSASLLFLLMNEGVKLDSFERIPLTRDLESLVDGRVDAYSGYIYDHPYDLGKRGIPFRIIRPDDYGINVYGSCLCTTRAEVKARPGRVKDMREASSKGWAYALSHTNEMIGLILRKYDPGGDPGKLAYEAGIVQQLILPHEIEIGHMNPNRWAAVVKDLHAIGLVDKTVDQETLAREFLFDPNDATGARRKIRILLAGGGAFAIITLFLFLATLSLKKVVRRRTEELTVANRLLTEENDIRRKAQFLLQLERDLAMAMATRNRTEEVLGHLLETVMRVPGVQGGGIYVIEEKTGNLRLAVHAGLSEVFVEACRQVEAGSPRHQIVMAGKPISLTAADCRQDRFVTAEGLRSVLVVPIKLGSAILGALNVGSRTLDHFPEDRSMAIETMAIQLGPIIDRLRALESLGESEQTYRNLAESAFDAILVSDKSGHFVYANRQCFDLTGYTPEELIGMPFSRIVRPDELAKINTRFALRMKGNPVPLQYESWFVRKDGSSVPIGFSASLVEWKGGEAVMAYCADLSSRKRLEEAVLKISQWEKSRIGHELHDSLGQQLTGIAYLCKGLEEDLAGVAPAQSDVAKQFGAHLRRSIDQLRRTVRGLAPVDLEKGGLEGGLSRLAADAESAMGITCRFLSPPTPFPERQSMAANLYHIAQESLNNAVKHGRAKTVTIRLAWDDRKGELAVEDDGLGLRAEMLSQDGSGMKIMQYRAAMVGGSLAVAGNEAGGVTVCCKFEMG